jgi:hypothetical protein
VLNNLSEQIRHCYRRAGECRELAELATRPSDKAFDTEREHCWLLLARSYDLQERSGLFARERLRRRKRDPNGQAPTCAVCTAPTRVSGFSIFVCTNCGRVVEDQ